MTAIPEATPEPILEHCTKLMSLHGARQSVIATDPLAAGYWWKKLRAPVILNEVKNLPPPLALVFLWKEILHFVHNDKGRQRFS